MNRIDHRARAQKLGVTASIYDALNGTMAVHLACNGAGVWQPVREDKAHITVTNAPSVGHAVTEANRTMIAVPFDQVRSVEFSRLGAGRVVNLYREA